MAARAGGAEQFEQPAGVELRSEGGKKLRSCTQQEEKENEEEHEEHKHDEEESRRAGERLSS